MVDQSRVTSGFDVELCLSAAYLRHVLIAGFDTGSIAWSSESSGNDDGGAFHRVTILHPPQLLADTRLYPVHPDVAGHEHPYLGRTVEMLLGGLTVFNRAYSDQLDDFSVTIVEGIDDGALVDIRVYPSVLDLLPDPPKLLTYNAFPLDVRVAMTIEPTLRDGLVTAVAFKLAVVDVAGAILTVPGGPGKDDILAQLRKAVDRTVPFGLGGSGALQGIAARAFVGEPDRPDAIGLYLNLLLRKGPGPGDVHPASAGEVNAAQNILAPETVVAFALRPGLFDRLGDDLYHRMARPDPDSPGSYHYPVMDGGEQVGRIKDVRVGPAFTIGSTGVSYPNILEIKVDVEFIVDNFPDPDATITVRLVPEVDARGVLDFTLDYDVEISPLAHIGLLLAGAVLAACLPTLGISFLVGLELARILAERAAAGMVRERMGEQLEGTNFLEVIPHKLVLESRRWDPLYATDHRLEVGTPSVVVNHFGFALDAQVVWVGRSTRPDERMVIRSETRTPDGVLDGLVFRAPNLGTVLTTDLVNTFAATDRLPSDALVPPQPPLEDHRVRLSMAQVDQRVADPQRHLAGIEYLPAKIELTHNRISSILAVTQRELDETAARTRGILDREIRQQYGTQLRQLAEAELTAELGRAPTSQEVDARLAEKVSVAVEALFDARYLLEVDKTMTFDLSPSEFADLQQRGVLVLGRDHLQIRTLTRNGRTTVFYRDYAPPFRSDPTADNLLALPHYTRRDS